jgi:hypothetical protein
MGGFQRGRRGGRGAAGRSFEGVAKIAGFPLRLLRFFVAMPFWSPNDGRDGGRTAIGEWRSTPASGKAGNLGKMHCGIVLWRFQH